MGVTSNTWVTSDTRKRTMCDVQYSAQHCASFPSECPKLPPIRSTSEVTPIYLMADINFQVYLPYLFLLEVDIVVIGLVEIQVLHIAFLSVKSSWSGKNETCNT